MPKNDGVRSLKKRWRAKMGLMVLSVEIPKRFAPRLKAMAERLTRRHVEKMEGKDDE